MNRVEHRYVAWWIALCCASAWASAGCNGVLGIEAPDDAVLFDSGVPVGSAGAPSAEYGAAGAPDDTSGADAGIPPITLDGGSYVEPNPAHRATWPMPNPVSTGLDHTQAYEIDDDGFVTDQVTKLEWQRSTDDAPLSLADAAEYCAELELGGDGYRLPTRIELLSLLDFTASSPSIDGDAFPNTPPDFFWSSSTFVADRSITWVVNFGIPAAFLSSAGGDSVYHVRCVRAPDDAPAQKFVTDHDSVRDSATELEWQAKAPDATYDFGHAEKYCKALDLDGGDWRLPTITELQTLVDETRSMPSIDPKAFPNTATDFYWSASTLTGSEDKVSAVSFRFGFDEAFQTDTEQHVRCVR